MNEMPSDITQDMTDIQVARKVDTKYGSNEGSLDGLFHSMSRWLGWSTKHCLEALQQLLQTYYSLINQNQPKKFGIIK